MKIIFPVLYYRIIINKQNNKSRRKLNFMSALWNFLTNDTWFFVSPLDWLIIILPLAFVLYMGWHSRRYVAQVSDFLTAGRLSGRYLIGVADIANGLSIISLVAYVEVHYRTGFALTFWQNLTLPLGVILSLTGFVTYRYRCTKAMSFGQFIEMRYSRGLRIFASALRSGEKSQAMTGHAPASFAIWTANNPSRPSPATMTASPISICSFRILKKGKVERNAKAASFKSTPSGTGITDASFIFV